MHANARVKAITSTFLYITAYIHSKCTPKTNYVCPYIEGRLAADRKFIR